ncbi:hypothetical protein PoB_002272500 [Plakobranchus ocellatus]|uniref:Uncharacterized protein n=1 Tax=Plakobranchus ocellatus TaxID=259542 RepID=A0AAV3ZNR3_9GAST|nr:hypothetical protein PoB_002272500 [Plakobranchus ocellatus]
MAREKASDAAQRVRLERVSKLGYWEAGIESKQLVFSRLIVAAAAGRKVFRLISEKRIPFLMKRAASNSPGDPLCGRSIPAFLQGRNSRLRAIQQ